MGGSGGTVAASSTSASSSSASSGSGGDLPGPPGLPSLTLTGGSQPVPVPFATWEGATVAVAPSATGTTYYVDAKNGNDSNTGTSAGTALKTIGASVGKVTAGDTVLIKAALYREVVDLSGISGAAGKPITFGSFGDGEVIVDGSTAVTGWVKSSGTVWQAQVAGGSNIDTVVVNSVPLARYVTTTAVPASGTGQWYFDGGTTLYADMGPVNPTNAAADVMVVRFNHADSTLFLGGSSYLNIIGLSIRGSGWAGIWSYPASVGVGGEHVNIAYCDIKFNDGAGLIFTGGSNNSSLYNRVYHNVLNNWPFGANGYAVDGGGWPGALGWSQEANPLARGNVVSLNGGEGVISYGNGMANNLQSGNTLFEQNVAYDNWSMNSYVDNQPNHVIRGNLFFRHSPNTTWMWDPTDVYSMEKFRTCLGLADEFGSGEPAGTPALANVQVYNNLFVGCRYGINDYFESTTGHGMKNDLIVNNTIIMDTWNYTDEYVAGISVNDNGANNSSTLIANNIIQRPKDCTAPGLACPLIGTMGPSKLTGITFSNNVYYASGTPASGTSLFATNAANSAALKDFAAWKTFEGADASSVYQDPGLAGASTIEPTGNGSFDYTLAGVGAGSPAKGLASPQTSVFTTDFAGAMRGASWTAGALQ